MNKADFSKTEKFLSSLAILFGIIGLFCFISAFLFFKNGEILFAWNLPINSTKFSEFGSFVGGVAGPIWALVSVILFYLTLRLQRKELVLQREELELTREELKGQKEELEKSNILSRLQQFDSKYFQLLNLHNQILNSIFASNTSPGDFYMENAAGIHFFRELARIISKCFYISEYSKYYGDELNEDKLHKIYIKAFHHYKAELGHYFRNLFHIVRIIDEANLLTDEEKYNYMKLLRAQLSNYELVLLAYNGLSPYGEKFYPFINKYELLKNIDFELLSDTSYERRIISPEILTDRYPHLNTVLKEQKAISGFE